MNDFFEVVKAVTDNIEYIEWVAPKYAVAAHAFTSAVDVTSAKGGWLLCCSVPCFCALLPLLPGALCHLKWVVTFGSTEAEDKVNAMVKQSKTIIKKNKKSIDEMDETLKAQMREDADALLASGELEKADYPKIDDGDVLEVPRVCRAAAAAVWVIVLTVQYGCFQCGHSCLIHFAVLCSTGRLRIV